MGQVGRQLSLNLKLLHLEQLIHSWKYHTLPGLGMPTMSLFLFFTCYWMKHSTSDLMLMRFSATGWNKCVRNLPRSSSGTWSHTMRFWFSYVLEPIGRENFPLYVTVLEALVHVPFFFALDHMNYSRWLPVHIRDMKRCHKRSKMSLKLGITGQSQSRHTDTLRSQ